MRRYFKNGSTVIGPKDINKNGTIESWEKARAKGMANGMGHDTTFKFKCTAITGPDMGRAIVTLHYLCKD